MWEWGVEIRRKRNYALCAVPLQFSVGKKIEIKDAALLSLGASWCHVCGGHELEHITFLCEVHSLCCLERTHISYFKLFHFTFVLYYFTCPSVSTQILNPVEISTPVHQTEGPARARRG